MLKILSVKLKNFKSFRTAQLSFPSSFVCFMGPNGSGKSNICDAIRFAFGETSMKALRVHSFKHLIHHKASSASVVVKIEADGKQHEIKRAINKDGKMEYRLDGKKTTRASIINLLRQHNVDESGRNMIGQGEIDRIVSLSPRERRSIIDSVAGISEFEEKKKEAMRNLEIVESRIRETSVLLGEKLSTLERLEKEKEEAELFLHHQKNMKNAKGTLLRRTLESLEKKLKFLERERAELGKEKENVEKRLDDVKEEIEKIGREMGSEKEMELRKEVLELSKQLESIKINEERTKAEIEERKKMLDFLNKERTRLINEMKKFEEEMNALNEEKTRLEKELGKSSVEEWKGERASLVFRNKLTELMQKKAEVEQELGRMEVRIEDLKDFLSDEKKMVDEREIDKIKGEISIIEQKIRKLFEEEKRLNKSLLDVDRALIEARERLGWLRAQAPKSAMSKVIEYIQALKRDIPGIHGPLIDLISFSEEYAKAVESAGGTRLIYIVVDDVDTAIKVVERLKKANVGRASFIPLREIKPSCHLPKGLVPLSSLVEYDPLYEKAVLFALGDTALVKDAREAKSVGIGKCRMVTLDGDLFEVSGVVTGGSFRSGIALASALAKAEEKVEALKSDKAHVLELLQDIRHEMAELRAKKAEKEVEMRTLISSLEEDKRKSEALEAKRKELDLLLFKAEELKKERNKLEEEIQSLSNKIVALEEEEKKKEQEMKRRYGETIAQISAMRERISNITKRLSEMMEEKGSLKKKLDEVEQKLQALSDEMNKKMNELMELKQEEKNLKARIAELEGKLQDVDEKHKKYSERLTELGKEKAALEKKLDSIKDQLRSLEVGFASANTKLSDIKAELDELGDFEILEEDETRLSKTIAEARAFMQEHPSVNLAAIELYEEKKREVGEVKERIDKLREEKIDILNLIGEIEKRKENAFFEVFHKVADAFKKMYEKTGLEGEGYLLLDKPSKPFESGLHIKVRRSGKDIDLLSLSGGEKALLALAFIFALESSKPSPFYILDEIDSALDAKNSRQIGMFLKKLAERTQFLVVSHREHMVACADIVFGVSRRNDESVLVGVKL